MSAHLECLHIVARQRGFVNPFLRELRAATPYYIHSVFSYTRLQSRPEYGIINTQTYGS